MPRGVPNAKKDELGMKYTTFTAPYLYVVELCVHLGELNEPSQREPQAHGIKISRQ